MRRDGSAEEFGEVWTLGPADLALVAGLPDVGRLGLAAQLAHWRAHGRLPDDEADLPPAAVARLAAELGVGAEALEAYDWSGRVARCAPTRSTHGRMTRRAWCSTAACTISGCSRRWWPRGASAPTTIAAGAPAIWCRSSAPDAASTSQF
jgi:Domain of unknown function (DUF4158)